MRWRAFKAWFWRMFGTPCPVCYKRMADGSIRVTNHGEPIVAPTSAFHKEQ